MSWATGPAGLADRRQLSLAFLAAGGGRVGELYRSQAYPLHYRHELAATFKALESEGLACRVGLAAHNEIIWAPGRVAESECSEGARVVVPAGPILTADSPAGAELARWATSVQGTRCES